ncbi:MAG: 50S ribosomal protein L4 [Chitinophagaceae bacterium]
MQIDVLNINGTSTGRKIELPDTIFGIEPNQQVLYLAVKQYLGAQRQGTHKVKSRGEVKGSSRKLHKQKGTGGSRKGNIRNPLYKGGGTIFGPKPRDYSFKLNKKVKDLARISALSIKAKDNAIVVVEKFDMNTPKTKEFVTIINQLKLSDKKTLFLTDEINNNIALSLRNLPYVKSHLLSDFNTYELMNADVLLLTEGAAQQFNVQEPIQTT